MTDDSKHKTIDSDISYFINTVKRKYGVNVHVVLGGLATKKQIKLVSLEVLIEEAYSAMCIYDPSLQYVTSLKDRTRRQDVVQWVHCFSYIAWHYGYSKTSIGRVLERNHATVIHSVKAVTDHLSIKDAMTTTIYNLLMNHYKDNVGNFSEHSKRQDNT